MAFYGRVLAHLQSRLGIVNSGQLSPMESDVFLQMKLANERLSRQTGYLFISAAHLI